MAKLISNVLNANSCTIVLLNNSKTFSIYRCRVSAKNVYFCDKKTKITNRLEKHIIVKTSSILNSRVLGVPIILEDIIGFIMVWRKLKDARFDTLDQEFLMTLAEQAGTGIRNLQLYDEQEKIILGSINSLITLLDSRLPRGYVHSPYFSKLVTVIAQQMNLGEDEIKTLQYASMLHDAGKLDIPLEILTKTTKLTKREFKIIKRHPIKGVQIIKHLDILKPVIPIILYHHERYDGKGYPSGLKGDRIPLGARIMALADAFEAMVYGRPYREKIDVKSAIEEIKRKSGTQFDPKVVEAFLKAIKLIQIKKEEYRHMVSTLGD
jgi:HD-GYP domain-containing protein (c-di-GMP phosphodiesterase class II)